MPRPKKETITRDLLEELIQNGYRRDQIAKNFNVSKNTISRRIAEYELQMAKGRPEGSLDKQKRSVRNVREYQIPEPVVLRPGPRPAEMLFSISDESILEYAQSIYDCHGPVAILQNEFKRQTDLPSKIKKIYNSEVK